MMKHGFTKAVGIAAGALFLAFTPCFLPAQENPPNFIIVLADDLGYGDIGSGGADMIRTPNLDRMAAEGVKLTRFYASASVCTPSRGGLLTGRYPIRMGLVRDVARPTNNIGMPAGEITLAEALKEIGYRTACIGKWHLGHRAEHWPTRHGFDLFYGLPYSNDMTPLALYRMEEKIEEPVEQSTLTERYTEEAVRFIEDSAGEPFFLYLPYAMPHLPVSASENFRGKSRAGLYGDVIETIDWSVGEIAKALCQQGLDENTLVIFTSDNGPWQNLPDRMLAGGVERWHTGSKGLLRGAKGSSYEGGIRVPFVARWPGRIPAGAVSADIVSILDIFPTLVGVAGAELPQDRKLDGRDVLPLLEGGALPPRAPLFIFRGRSLEGVRQGPWKLRISNETDRRTPVEGTPQLELFNLDIDPSEFYNVADRQPEIRDRLLGSMQSFTESSALSFRKYF